jgi:hypothetical protein
MIYRLFRTLLLCLLLTSIGCGEKTSVNKIDSDKLVENNPQLSLVDDNVRIRVTPQTQAAGVAGRIGNVAGFTKPSYSRVEVIGEVKDDLAFSVIFENPHAQLWFAPELLEFVDHAPGLDIQIGKKRLVRRADGGWDEVPK